MGVGAAAAVLGIAMGVGAAAAVLGIAMGMGAGAAVLGIAMGMRAGGGGYALPLLPSGVPMLAFGMEGTVRGRSEIRRLPLNSTLAVPRSSVGVGPDNG